MSCFFAKLTLAKKKTAVNNSYTEFHSNLKNGLVADIKLQVFNNLPQNLKTLVHDTRKFKCFLKRFLYQHSFYSMEEYYDYKEELLLLVADSCAT